MRVCQFRHSRSGSKIISYPMLRVQGNFTHITKPASKHPDNQPPLLNASIGFHDRHRLFNSMHQIARLIICITLKPPHRRIVQVLKPPCID